MTVVFIIAIANATGLVRLDSWLGWSGANAALIAASAVLLWNVLRVVSDNTMMAAEHAGDSAVEHSRLERGPQFVPKRSWARTTRASIGRSGGIRTHDP